MAAVTELRRMRPRLEDVVVVVTEVAVVVRELVSRRMRPRSHKEGDEDEKGEEPEESEDIKRNKKRDGLGL